MRAPQGKGAREREARSRPYNRMSPRGVMVLAFFFSLPPGSPAPRTKRPWRPADRMVETQIAAAASATPGLRPWPRCRGISSSRPGPSTWPMRTILCRSGRPDDLPALHRRPHDRAPGPRPKSQGLEWHGLRLPSRRSGPDRREVFTVEIHEGCPTGGRDARAPGARNVRVRSGDGFFGWPEEAPFDGIIVTAAAPEVPAALFAQLKEGGRLVIPLATPGLPGS